MNLISLTDAIPIASSYNSRPSNSLDPGLAACNSLCIDAGQSSVLDAAVRRNFPSVSQTQLSVSHSHTMPGSKYGLHMKRRLLPLRSKLYVSSVRRIPSNQCEHFNSIREDAADPLVFPGKCIGSTALCIAAGKPPALQLERSRCATAQRWSR